MAEKFGWGGGGGGGQKINHKMQDSEKQTDSLYEANIPRSPKASDQSTVNRPQEMNQSMKLTTSDGEQNQKMKSIKDV